MAVQQIGQGKYSQRLWGALGAVLCLWSFSLAAFAHAPLPAVFIDWSNDAIVKTTREVATNAQGKIIVRFNTYSWFEGSTGTLVGVRELTADGLERKEIALDAAGAWTNSTVVAYEPANRIRRVTETSADGSYTVTVYQDGRLSSIRRYTGGDAPLGGSTFAYDPHGRLLTTTDTRTGTVATNAYNAADWLTAESLEASGLAAQTTLFEHDQRGRVKRMTLPDALTATNTFYANGLPKYTGGARTYPSEVGYDPQGRMRTLTTWTNTGTGGSAVTSWSHDPATGYLTNKAYAGGASGPSFTFTSAGRPKTRLSARGVTTTYSTNVAGQVSAVDYSDATPDVGLAYDRQGRLKTVTSNGVTVATRTYNNLGQLTSEAQGAVTVSNVYNSLLQLESVGLWRSNTNFATTTFQYDGASRLQTVLGSVFQVTNYYLANSSLPQAQAFRVGSQTPLTVHRTFDDLDRLQSISSVSSVASVASVASFSYGFNSANQRSSVTNADGSKWDYQYDYLGQLTNAARRWSDGSLVAGQQFSYSFDEIGNRRATMRDARTGVNAVDLLNRATGRNNPGYVNILGTATNTATVTINYQPTERKGDYFRKELAVTNTSGPVWQGITNIAVLQQATNDLVATNLGRLYVPPAAETLLYDADGNQVSDGRWTNQWDAENRLISQESTAAAVAAGVPKQKLSFAYDWMGRRVSKTVSNWTGSAWALDYSWRFVYDQWNLAAILDASSSTLLATFVWGNDLSGSRHGAGGVGGLLAMTLHTTTNAGTYFYAYDGNGNVAGVINATNGQVAAQYEYGGFGELLRATGPLAFANPFLFSTKYYDWETGLYYYGYRYYSPELGRWLSRDPHSELGGYNLYAFCGNDPINSIDPVGLDNIGCRPLPGNSLSYNNAPITLTITIQPELQPAPDSMSAKRPSVFDGKIESPRPQLDDPTVINPQEVPTGRSIVTVECGGNDLVFDLPRVLALNQMGATVRALVSPVRYIEAFDRNLSLEMRREAYWEATAGTAMYLAPVVGGRLARCGQLTTAPVGQALAFEMKGGQACASAAEGLPDAYAGIRQASQYLQEMGVARADRVRILQSFEAENMAVRQAGQSEYGLRYFSDPNRAGGSYLFETFPASRESLAIKPEWSTMSGFRQFQIQPGTTLLEGRAAAQGACLPGGQVQKFILDWRSGLIPPQ